MQATKNWVRKIHKTSWSFWGPGVEVGLAPNIMKGINIFTVDVIKDFSYNLWQNNSTHVTETQQETKILTLKVFEMMPHSTLKFQIMFWAPQAYLP
jgi:hypothetical protein